MKEEWELISKYTREDALADGVLHDISSLAKEASFKFPVAITEGVLEKCTPTDRMTGQSLDGRLWDVLHILRHAIKRLDGTTDRVSFKVLMTCRYTMRREYEDFEAVCGPGDNMEPVITIELPGED